MSEMKNCCLIAKSIYKSQLTIYTPTISPNKPIALPKISTINILTNNDEFAASAKAAPDPTIPTAKPQNKLTNPTIKPAPNIKYAPIKFFALNGSLSKMLSAENCYRYKNNIL